MTSFAVSILTENSILYRYLESLVNEAGFAVTGDREKASAFVVDLDTALPFSEDKPSVTLSAAPFLSCDLTRPFGNRDFLALCRERFGEDNCLVSTPASYGSMREETNGKTESGEESEEALNEVFITDGSGVTVAGERIALSGAEYRLFALLLSRRGEAVSVKECAEAIKGAGSLTESNAVSVYVNHLRRKLDYRFNKRMIVTLRHKGYCLL